MKKTIRLLSLLLATLLCLCALTACGGNDITTATTTTTTGAGGAPQAPSLPAFWDTATYRADAEIGTGATTFTLIVQAEQYGISLTVHTDETVLGDALIALSLISGEQGAYGLYVKTVNGMTLDPDKSNVYWALFVGDDYAMTGIDATPITAGATYTLSYASF
jgi:hypothetical protein